MSKAIEPEEKPVERVPYSIRNLFSTGLQLARLKDATLLQALPEGNKDDFHEEEIYAGAKVGGVRSFVRTPICLITLRDIYEGESI